MRILITGANGQLGRELQAVFASHQVVAPSHHELDVTDSEDVRIFLESTQPETVVHAAALTDTSRCEREPKLAMQVNALGAENVARSCRAVNASMVYISTNEVFDGGKTTPYVEADLTSPVSEYGRSKLKGEERVREELHQHYVVRTSWLYGAGGDNFVAKVQHWAESGKLTGVIDEVATPTWAHDLSSSIAQLIETGHYGTYHLSNKGEASRYDWAREILRLCGKTDVEVEPITTLQFRDLLRDNALAPEKPPYSVLANTAGAALGIHLQPWKDALAAFLAKQE